MADVLHVRCGDDLRPLIAAAGLGTHYLTFADPLCRGPVPAPIPDNSDGDERAFSRVRAAFLAQAYDVDEMATRSGLEAASLELTSAFRSRSVVLWFEHDSYDQLILARILARLAELGDDAVADVRLICLDRHPNHARFLGLAQLDADELAALWPQRRPVSNELTALGQAVWAALRASEPVPLAAIAITGTAPLPIMAPALRRHLQELPWTTDGLGLTQRLVLQALARGATTPGQIFAALQTELEPLPFLGDLMLWADIRELAAWREPPLRVTGEGPWARRASHLTPAGERLLAGSTDARDHGPVARWLGGVLLTKPGIGWRWDDAAAMPVRTP